MRQPCGNGDPPLGTCDGKKPPAPRHGLPAPWLPRPLPVPTCRTAPSRRIPQPGTGRLGVRGVGCRAGQVEQALLEGSRHGLSVSCGPGPDRQGDRAADRVRHHPVWVVGALQHRLGWTVGVASLGPPSAIGWKAETTEVRHGHGKDGEQASRSAGPPTCRALHSYRRRHRRLGRSELVLTKVMSTERR